MRPRPMKPQLTQLAPVEAKDRLEAGPTKPAPFPSKHSREGEKRMDTAALIFMLVVISRMDKER